MTDHPGAPQDRPEPTPPEGEAPLLTYMTTKSPIARDAAFLRMYAERVRNRTAVLWEIPNTVASTLEDIAARIIERGDVAVPARANHPQDEETKDVMARSEVTEIRDRQPAAVTDWGEQDDSAGGVTMDDVNRINNWLNTCADRATSVEERLSIGRLMNKVHILWERGSYGVRKRG